MSKVHLFLDSTYGLHLWDSEVLEALGNSWISDLTEVPQELVDKYNFAAKNLVEAQEELKKYYHEANKQATVS